jgi:uncharacterized protein YcfL
MKRILVVVTALVIIAGCSSNKTEDGTSMRGLDIDRQKHCINASLVYNLNSTVKSVGKSFVCKNLKSETSTGAEWVEKS